MPSSGILIIPCHVRMVWSSHLANTLLVIIPFVVSVSSSSSRALDTIFSNWNLDSLQSKALAQLCTLDDTRELLGREHLEWLRENGRENGGRAVIDHRRPVGGIGRMGSHVDKIHLEATFC